MESCLARHDAITKTAFLALNDRYQLLRMIQVDADVQGAQAQHHLVRDEMEDPHLHARTALIRTSRFLADQNNAVVLARPRDGRVWDVNRGGEAQRRREGSGIMEAQ